MPCQRLATFLGQSGSTSTSGVCPNQQLGSCQCASNVHVTPPSCWCTGSQQVLEQIVPFSAVEEQAARR